jgi:hypothetical protein
MVPPPDNMGDEFPDFDSMTPDEQLAWLESLAKRQGASDDELITAANVDIPVPEDAEVDEPGYVPFEGSRSAREAQQAAFEAQEPEPELPAFERAEAEPIFHSDEEFETAISQADFDLESEAEPGDLEFDFATEPGVEEPQEAADSLFWLDSLAVQSEDLGDLDLFSAAGIEAAEEPAAHTEEEKAVHPPALESDLMEEFDLGSLPEEMADLEQLAAAGDELLGGADPMLWLESLAMRQGARKEELVTSADLDIAEVSEDAVVDEPGYVPFEGSRSARETQQAASVGEGPGPESAETGLEPVAETFEEITPPELELEEETAADREAGPLPEMPEFAEAGLAAEEADLLGGADPLKWLESLAKRQGAKTEEFITSADLEIPEVPEGTAIDEPGYVAYSPFSILPSDQEIELPEHAEEEIEQVLSGAESGLVEESLPVSEQESFEPVSESFSWLEDLAAEPDEDLVQFLAVDEEAAGELAAEEAAESVVPAEPEMAPAGDPLAGMTDEEVAYAQAHGQLTGEQELAWLKRQAAKLAEARQSQEMAALSEEELEPAEPVEQLPDWVMGMRPEDEQEAALETDELVADLELPAEVVELTDWLQEPEAEARIDLPELVETGAAELSLDADVESLWADTGEEKFVPVEETIPESELVAFLEGRLAPTEPDPLAEALDAEFDRKLEGDESEPEWYTDAVAKIASEAPAVDEAKVESPAAEEVQSEPVLTPGSQGDMPDWLVEKGEEAEVAAVGDTDVPSWLQGTGEEPTAVMADVPSWLTEGLDEQQPVAEAGTAPDWLSEFDKMPEQAVPEWVPEETPEPEAAVALEPEPEPTPVEQPEPLPVKAEEPPAPAAMAEPVAPVSAKLESIPEGELFDEYRRRLQENPNDHPNRLALARALRTSQELTSSLDQYETLLDASQLLQDVSDDLATMVDDHPDIPRVRRLLGDAYLRSGMLQEALDAYRSALDQL